MFGHQRLLTMITNDTEYQQAIKDLLDDLNSRLTNPEWMPVSHDEQAQFIHSVLRRTHEIVNSEPYLRGKVVESFDKMKEFDVETIEKDRDKYREVANSLYNALSVCRGLSKKDREARKQALEAAEKVL